MIGDIAAGVGCDETELTNIGEQVKQIGFCHPSLLKSMAGRGVEIYKNLAKSLNVPLSEVNNSFISSFHVYHAFQQMAGEEGCMYYDLKELRANRTFFERNYEERLQKQEMVASFSKVYPSIDWNFMNEKHLTKENLDLLLAGNRPIARSGSGTMNIVGWRPANMEITNSSDPESIQNTIDTMNDRELLEALAINKCFGLMANAINNGNELILKEEYEKLLAILRSNKGY